jgi:hypothetical protein
MITPPETLAPQDWEWEQLREKFHQSDTLASLVLAAWQMGMGMARGFVMHELHRRAQQRESWGNCPVCGTRLHSKGYVHRRMLTLVGWVDWERRVGRCPNHCKGSQSAPLDEQLGIAPYAQTSVELVRLGCLLALFLPYGLAVEILQQLCGVRLSDAVLWQWVQQYGKQAQESVNTQLQDWQQGNQPDLAPLSAALAALPLLIGADGVSVPFRPQVGSPKGKIVYQEIKVALLVRLGSRLKRSGERVSQLLHRRIVAVRGDIEALQGQLQLETHRQSIEAAPQVAWISDGARGLWGLFERCFAPLAVGILDFYHATQHLFEAAQAYGHTLPTRTPDEWFTRLRHQLRHGYVHRIIREFSALLRYHSTPESAKPTLKRVRDYLRTHLQHLQYRAFKKQGLPIGSGMVESACKWLITQRFKGVGMRWSEAGFDHLLVLRVAWVNQRFDTLFSQHPLSPTLYSPNQ